MKNHIRTLLIASALLSGCATTWSTSQVDKMPESGVAVQNATVPSNIIVTDSDITDRPYMALGEISVTVNKTTLFHDDPTKEMVNKKLQEEAAKLGADAVVLIKYGKGGVSLMSWGSLEGKGRAIKFTR